MSTLPRAATSPELAKIRSGNQSSRFFLTVQAPATVFTARLAAVPTSTDNVASVTYNTGSGAGYTDITVGQTMYVGTTAGAYDLGMVRIRTLSGLGAVTGTFNIGLTSEIAWASNCYLTIVDAFDFWPRSPFGANMDYDVAYTDQHSHCASIPIFPRYHVKWLTGSTVTVVLDGSQSWALNNTITNYSWHAPGNSALSGDSTNTVTITYNALNAHAGYRVELDLTNSDNVDSAGFGRVFVLGSESDAITQFRVDKIEGSYSSGGWSAQITMYGQADLSTIRDRALCIIHRRDWYGAAAGSEGSIGYITGDENIEMVGWIAGDTIKWAPHFKGEGAVTFTIQGPQYWLNKLTMPAVGLKNISSHLPTNWKRFTGLTAKAATWHILHWRTTAPLVIDCFMIDNNYGALQLQGSGAQTVWQQLTTVLNDFLLAKPCCDSYGRLFMQIEQNLLPASTRSSIPTVMTVTTGDWMNQIDFERREVLDVAAVDFSGDVYDGTTSTPTYALSPGRTIGSRGSSVFQRDRLVLFDQTTTNALAGAAMGWKNNPYPKWKFLLPSNLHLIDLAPYQYLATDIVTSDTQRGISATNLRLIPRNIRRIFNNGQIDTEVDVEAETPIYLAVTGDTPPTPPIVPVVPPVIPPPPPPPVPVPSGNARELWAATSGAIYWTGDISTGGQFTWNLVAGGVPGTLNGFNVSQSGIAYASTATTIYQCNDPKSTSPTWTPIATVGTNTGSGTIVTYFGYTVGPMTIVGNTLITTAAASLAWVYGEWNGSAWAWTNQGTANMFRPGDVGLDSWMDQDLHLYDRNHGFIETLPTYPGAPGDSTIWHRAGGPRYIVSGGASGGLVLRIATSATISLGTATAPSQITETKVRGAVNGAQVYCVNAYTGHLFLSDNGSTFNDTFTWQAGWVNDMALAGGGSLIWLPLSVVSSNEMVRISNTRGASWLNMTGNFWSVASGNQTFVGCGLVYP